MVVGEAHVAPTYFLTEMEWWEIQAVFAGLRRGERIHYYAAQWLAGAIGCVFSSESHTMPGWGEPWTWEDGEEHTRISEEDIEAARRLLLQ